MLDILQDLRDGATAREFDEALRELVATVRATGKAGSVTLSLHIKPASSGAEYFNVRDKITSKLPELPKGDTFLFATKDNGLSLRDPRQVEIPGTEKKAAKPDPDAQAPDNVRPISAAKS